MAHVYHWKHGWIPLDHTAALSKAKGDRAAADKLLADAHGPSAGINSRQDVAKAALGIPKLPEHERPAAYRKLKAAADRHGAHDLIPVDTAAHAAPRSTVKRPDDHDLSKLSDSALDAAIGRAGPGKLRDELQAEKRRRGFRLVRGDQG